MASNKQKETPVIILTEQQKELIEQLKVVLSTDYIDIDKISLNKDSLDDYYSITYNFMGTGIHIPEKEVNEFEFEQNGIKIWKTWTQEY